VWGLEQQQRLPIETSSTSLSIAEQPATPTRRWRFVTACLLFSALLSAIFSANSTIGVGFFLVSGLLTLWVMFVVNYVKTHEPNRWLIRLSMIGLVVVLIINRIFPRIGADQVMISSMWVGSSYLILRLIHLLVDYQRIKYNAVSDLGAYALFPPALIAGPVHRAPAFLTQLDQLHSLPQKSNRVNSLWRMGLGIFKKLALANGFALFAMNAELALNPNVSVPALWIGLICYAFMLYFDFAGYSDIVIGVAGLAGITLPENFANPYAQPNITRFWQSWHMSLSSWLRDYLFFPISRTLLTLTKRRNTLLVMAFAQIITMVLAGLWHGFNSGFYAWGIWHGIGLFVHAQWRSFETRIGWQIPSVIGVALTFLFVCLGWTFFALGDAKLGFIYIQRLFGR
jgi:alginate O-acetyltransferase complex protein AlgI